MGDVYRDGVFRLHGERAGLCAEAGDLLLRADEHCDVAAQLFALFELLHREQDGRDAGAVIQTFAAELIARERNRRLTEHDGRADTDAALGVEETGVDRHLADRHGLVLLAGLQQMGRHTGDDAVERLVCEQRDLAAEQHARIDAADRREADKAAVQHLGHEKADLVEMRVEQHGLCVFASAGPEAEHIAVFVYFDRVAVRTEQLSHSLGRLRFVAADRRQRGERPQSLF